MPSFILARPPLSFIGPTLSARLIRASHAVRQDLAFARGCLYPYFVEAWLQSDAFPAYSGICVGRNFPIAFPIDKQFRLRTSGEGHERLLRTRAKDATLLGQMEHGLIGTPVGFVEIEGVFARAAVESDQTFVIDAGAVAFMTMGGSEVKHVPYETTPQIRPGRNGFPVFYVIISLPVLRMPGTSRLRFGQSILLMVDTGTGTVFTDSNTKLRMVAVGLVKPAAQVGRGAPYQPS